MDSTRAATEAHGVVKVKAAKKRDEGSLCSLLSSAAAGATEGVLMMPLDTIKTRAHLDIAYNNPIKGAMLMVKEEGPSSLFKGTTAVVLGITPKVVVRFMAFEQYRSWMPLENVEKNITTPVGLLAAGVLAGITEAVVVVTPSEMIKVRMQDDARGGTQKRYTSVLRTTQLVVKEEGIAALYKGLSATCFRQASSSGIRFMMYGKLLQLFREMDSKDGVEAKNQSWHAFAAGGLAGFVTAVVNNPIDVIKTRLQRQESAEGVAKYRGSFHCLTTMVKEEGLVSLGRGMAPRVLRIVPGQAIVFGSYQTYHDFLSEYL